MTKIFLIILLATSTACGKSTNNETVLPVCEKAWWDLTYQENCNCHDSHKLVDTAEGKKCVDETVSKKCSEMNDGYSKTLELIGQEAFAKCLIVPNKKQSFLNLITPNLVIEVRDASMTEQKKLAQWADDNSHKITGLSSWSSAGMSGEILVLAKQPAQVFIDSVLRPLQMPIIPVDYILYPIAPKLFSTAAHLTAYLDNPQGKSAVDQSDFSFDNRAAALSSAYRESFKAGLKVDKTVSVDECLSSCARSAEAFAVGDFTAQYREYVIENQVYRSEIVLINKQNDIAGSLYLAGQHFSTLVLIDRDSFGVPTSQALYSIDGELVHKSSVAAVNPSELLSLREKALSKKRYTSVVGVCENNFNLKQFEAKGWLGNLAFGPGLDESYFGWDKSNSGSAAYWTAAVYFNDLGLPYNFNNFSDHATLVSEVLLAGTNKETIGIAPLGMETCLRLSGTAQIWPQVKEEENFRVINISASDETDAPTCMAGIKNHPLMTDPNVLWVVAAGNRGVTTPQTCPQFLSGSDNMIVVGALNGSNLVGSKGRNFVDVAASGKAAVDSFGTSFAAPRVSALAATVFDKYPELTAYQVKMAILLAAQPKYGWGLDVRSEGEIHPLRTLKYAKTIAAGSSIVDAISIVECDDAEYTCYQAEEKLKLYNDFK